MINPLGGRCVVLVLRAILPIFKEGSTLYMGHGSYTFSEMKFKTFSRLFQDLITYFQDFQYT
jgi:hypothetical protein